MNMIILPYILAPVLTLLFLLIAGTAFFHYRRNAAKYEYLSQWYPDLAELQDVQDRLHAAKKEYAEALSMLANARSTIAQSAKAEESFVELKGKIEDTERRLLAIRKEAITEEARLHQLEQSRATLQSQKDQATEDVNSLRQQIASDSQSHRQLVQDVESTQHSVELLQQEEGELVDKKQRLSRELKEAADRCEVLKAQQSALRGEVAGLEAQVRSCREQIGDAQIERDRLFRLFEQQKSEAMKERDRALVGCKTEIDRARTEYDTLQEQYKDVQRQIGEATQERSKIKAEISGLNAARDAAQVSIDELKQSIGRLRNEWDRWDERAKQTRVSDERRTVELWRPVFCEKYVAGKKRLTELDALASLQEHLDACNLRFSRRVVWAFHTSLKVSQISPLVVLAGISGTGKSELPRRYAEAMKMHFLNIAVQPRWDSPQDMFGFYNYLENCYRATELGRALIQMDPYYKEPNRGWATPKGWESLGDQMLLVLLDEMNLARIEYYFSEFLSRLETRRGINPEIAEERSKAEIRLDTGYSASGNAAMQVFVGGNVLFVGSMNEDETTQSLSDKVVDRANVLRFGKPTRFTASSNGEEIQAAAQERLSLSLWRKWCKPDTALDDETSQKISAYIDRLNAAMSQIRRPFAYRTNLAMRTYIANYPNLQDGGLECAVADQIEQKIFPKFRGLDPMEDSVKRAFGEVRDVLAELGDTKLIAAIDEARNQHAFAWLGVDRLAEDGEAWMR